MDQPALELRELSVEFLRRDRWSKACAGISHALLFQRICDPGNLRNC